MTYDEHYSGSPVAGSIASLPWVEEAVRETLKEVPKDQILMGVPMYTRVWVVDGSGKIIRNPSASMAYIENLIAEKNLLPFWLSKEKQNFVSYPNGSYTEKIWIEDSRSIANRLDLVQTYDLAGSACWQYSQANDEIWSVFSGMLKDGKTLSDYK
jgi:spore germination protein YaaH